MEDKLNSKMKSYFGNESLIMYSKFHDYYEIEPIITEEDIKIYYNFLMNDPSNNQKKINDISCCLYYLSNNNIKYQDIFKSQIIEKIDINKDLINSNNLILIYNIIEFDERYLKSDREKIQYLLNYLERFSELDKSSVNILLFKYYRACLKLNLGDIDSANAEYLENIVYYEENIISKKKETKYTLFIRLQNDLINLRIIKNKNEDNNETKIFLKEYNNKIQNDNQFNLLEVDNSSNSIIKGSDVWVKQLVDYRFKFGVGYLLNNGNFGILFNDNSKIILNPNTNIFFYIEKNLQDNQKVINIYNNEAYPKELNKKVILLQCCKKELEGKDIYNNKELFNNDKEKNYLHEKRELENNKKEINNWSYIFVTKYMKIEDATIYRLSNKYYQVCFKDETEIILSFETKVFTYVNKQKERLTYFLNEALEESNSEMIAKLINAEDILTHFKNIYHSKKEQNNININMQDNSEKESNVISNNNFKNIININENEENEKNEYNNKNILLKLNNFDDRKNIEDEYASYLEKVIEQEKQNIKIENTFKKGEELQNVILNINLEKIKEMEKNKNKNVIDIEQEKQKILLNNNHIENLEKIKNLNKKDEYAHLEEMEKMKNKNDIDKKEMDMKLIVQEYIHKENMLKFDNEFKEKQLAYDLKSQQINSENKKIELDYKKDMEINEMKIKNSFILNEKEMANKYKINEKEIDYRFEIEKMKMEHEYQLEKFKLILEKIPADKLIEIFRPQITNNNFTQVNQQNFFMNPPINQQNLNYQNSNSKCQDYQDLTPIN